MENYGKIIHRTWDNSYVIKNGTYHIPNEGEYAQMWQDVHAYAVANPTMVTEEYPYTPSLEEVRARKIAELKSMRDSLEVEPIAYNGKLFDFDDKARDRINSAIIALDMQGEGASLSWTTADNTEAIVTANDLRGVIASVAVRSNELHIHYRTKREAVDNATTKEEVEAIEW